MKNAQDDLISKVKAIVRSQQGELFAKIVESFYEQIGEEYFSAEDMADIEEGLEEIRRGEVVAWEEAKRKYEL